MSKGLNKVTAIGNCGSDPEVKASGDRTIAKVSIAVTESWKDKQSGEKKERTEWIRCTFFDPVSKVVRDYVKKGSRIYVEGQLRTSSYGEENDKRYSTEVVVRDLILLDSKGGSGGEPVGKYPDHEVPRQETDPFEDEEIPF